MRTIFSFCLVFFFTASVTAQNDYTKVIHEFAELKLQAMKEHDLDKRIALTHPNIIAMAGGKESFVSILETERKVFDDQNMKIVRGEFDAPGKIVKAGQELHCLLKQKLIIEFDGAEAEQTTNLLAASLDEGETWTFVDLNQHDTSSIKIFFPYYNDELMDVLAK